jgi:hypothetical protein
LAGLRPFELGEEGPEELFGRVLAPKTLGRGRPPLDLKLEHVRVVAESLLEVLGIGNPPPLVEEPVIDLLPKGHRPVHLEVDGRAEQPGL